MQIQSKYLQINGDHQCSKKCLEYLEEAVADSSEYEEWKDEEKAEKPPGKQLKSVLAQQKKKLSKIDKAGNQQRLS